MQIANNDPSATDSGMDCGPDELCHIGKPTTSLMTVITWAGMAADDCQRTSRKDAEALWRDAIAWLSYFKKKYGNE